NEQRVEQLQRQIYFLSSYMEARRQRDHVLVVAADVEHTAVAATADLDVALQAFLDHSVDDGLGRSIAVVGLANFHAQRQTEPVDISDRLVPPLQILQAFEEIGALLHHHRLVIGLLEHAHDLETDAGSHRIGIECRMGGAWRKYRRIDQCLAGPDAGKRVKAVREGLSDHENVRFHIEMFDRPELPGSIEAHLDFIDDQQNAVLIENLFELLEEILRRDDVAAGSLNRLDVESRELGLAGLRVPNAVVLAFEQPGELRHAIAAVLLLAHALRATEVVRERQEVGALAEMAVAAAIAIGRRNSRSAKRAAVISTLEGEHQALALLGVADELEAVL